MKVDVGSVVVVYSLFLAALIVVLSLPIIIRRIWLALHRDDFDCLMCGNCCRFRTIDLTKEDVELMEKHGHKDFYEPFEGHYRIKRVNGRCPFNFDDKCGVYDHRAAVCRNFPFFPLWGCIPFIHEWSCCPGIEEMKRKLKEKGKKKGGLDALFARLL